MRDRHWVGMIKLQSKGIRHMNTAITIRGHEEEGGEKNTSESLITNTTPSILLKSPFTEQGQDPGRRQHQQG